MANRRQTLHLQHRTDTGDAASRPVHGRGCETAMPEASDTSLLLQDHPRCRTAPALLQRAATTAASERPVREPTHFPGGVARVTVTAASLLFAGLTSAASTNLTIVNSNHTACGSLQAGGGKAAGIPNMSDAQLCDFFALRSSRWEGFSRMDAAKQADKGSPRRCGNHCSGVLPAMRIGRDIRLRHSCLNLAILRRNRGLYR